jgi:hypothetical protein
MIRLPLQHLLITSLGLFQSTGLVVLDTGIQLFLDLGRCFLRAGAYRAQILLPCGVMAFGSGLSPGLSLAEFTHYYSLLICLMESIRFDGQCSSRISMFTAV